jgi:uncharacterized protein CbrC (UPF0167 family)
MTTSFRLFRAPLSEAGNAVEGVDCSLCGASSVVGFALGIGAEVLVACAACGLVAALDADERAGAPCARCGTTVDFPAGGERIFACQACLGAGRAAITKDTELGMVRWMDAQEGRTHGLPGFHSTEWPTSPPTDDGWVRVVVPREHLLELVRTPAYPSIQGERWLFCCREPMAFLGEWSRERFAREAPDGNGRALFEAVVEEAVPGLWEDELHDVTGIYVFECCRCARRRAHWDIA